MKSGGKTLICSFCSLALTLAAYAVVNDSGTSAPAGSGDSPYSAIWVRNVFDLKAPAPAVEAVKAATPPPNVTLTGITTLLGSKRALFMVQDPQPPGKPPSKEESYILTEGQRQGMLEVLEINPKAGTVKIKNEDIISTITFTTNKNAGGGGGPGPAPSPMAAGMPQPFTPPSFGQPPGINPAPNSMPMPSRMIRNDDPSQYNPQSGYAQPNSPSGYPSGYGYGQGGIAATSGASAGLNLFNQASPQQTVPNQPANLSAEEQVAVMLAQKASFEQGQGGGGGGSVARPALEFPPMPPLPGAQNNNSSSSSGSSGGSSPPAPPSPFGSKGTGTYGK